MPKNDSYGQGVQYPVLSDAPNIETATSTMLNGIVPLTVMRFASANARAAAFTGLIKLVPGMVTYIAAEDRWEARQANGTWLLLSDGPWQPLTFKTGYIAQGGSPGWRAKAGGGIELRGRFQKSNSGNLDESGTIVPFATLPTAARPGALRYFICASNRVTSGGVTRYTARVEVNTDGEMRYTVEAGGGTGSVAAPAWIALDAVSFSTAGD